MPFPFFLPLDVQPSIPHMAAVSTRERITIDGKLDEPAWKRAKVSEAFTQKYPNDGKKPAEPTLVRVLYDDENVYIGVDCVQHVPVIARLTRRDRRIETDSVTVDLDTRRDGTSGFEFYVNAAGVLSDGIRFDDTNYSDQWDENWEAKTFVYEGGWSVEMKIPLRILRFDAAAKQSWGFEVRRYTSERQETDEWAYIPRDAAGEVSRYGKLDDLEGLHVDNPLELRPFIVGEVRHFDDKDPNGTIARGWTPSAKIGLDLKWHINQKLTLDATFDPDFGQVEADQVVLNLTNYEVYYPEKRTFFLEGIDAFTTPLQLLYTRRIGAAPPVPYLRSSSPYDEQLYREPDPSTIWGAAKITGELGGRWSVGELLALTGRQTVPVQQADGSMVDRAVDPWTSYKVLRLRRAFGQNSQLGFIALATNHYEQANDYPVLPDPVTGKPTQLCPQSGYQINVGDRCYHDSYVGGVDGRWRSENGDYSASGQIIASAIENGPPTTLLDGTVMKSGDVSSAFILNAAKEGGKHWVGNVTYDYHGRKVDYDDLGFMQRQNRHHGYLDLEYRTVEPWWTTNETHQGLEWSERDTLDLLNLQRNFDGYLYWRFKNNWGIYASVGPQLVHYDDREMGDGAALERAALWDYEFAFGSDPRDPVNANLWFDAQTRSNGYTLQLDGTIGTKPLPQLDVDLLPTAIYTTGEPRWFDTENGYYLFGKQRAESLSLTLRATYTFTPRLTFQAYAQLFLASEHFWDTTQAPARGIGQVVHLSDLQPVSFTPALNPDFEEGAFNANLVLRWEYRLGSLLYVVYTHAQDTTFDTFQGDDAGLNFRLVKPRLAADIFLFKLSYWWS